MILVLPYYWKVFIFTGGMKMVRSVRNKNILALFLVAAFLLLSIASDGYAHRRSYRHRHSKGKVIAIGTAIGAVGGALIGGKKGALIGAGAGAGTGYVVHKRRSRGHRRP
jgi:osmotically inducible lipoprotein OsmB